MYQYNNKGAGRHYEDWSNTRGSTKQQLEKLPPITTSVNGSVRYYSAIDAELYFGDIYVDEVTNITWSIQQQVLPIYGFNSYTFDDLAVGSRLIQGQFAINFTQSNFLTKLQSSSSFQKISRRIYGEDIAVADTDSGKIYSDFRQRLHLPVWDKGFDLVIGFGETEDEAKANNKGIYGTYLILNCVQVTGSQIQLDYNGDPIMEIYSFIARDIKETFADATEINPSSVTSDGTSGSTADGTKLSLTGSLDLTKALEQLCIQSSSKVIFTSGTMQFVGTFKDKQLTLQNDLTPKSDQLVLNLNQSTINSLKNELGGNTSINCSVKYQYTSQSNTNQGQVLTDTNTIQLSVKS